MKRQGWRVRALARRPINGVESIRAERRPASPSQLLDLPVACDNIARCLMIASLRLRRFIASRGYS
jgi:hypothetical protein